MKNKQLRDKKDLNVLCQSVNKRKRGRKSFVQVWLT